MPDPVHLTITLTHGPEGQQQILAAIQQLGEQTMSQLDDIKAVLASAADSATKLGEAQAELAAAQTEIAADVQGLLDRVTTGAPQLLTAEELAAAQATVARISDAAVQIKASADALTTLGQQTDPTTAGQPATPAPPTP